MNSGAQAAYEDLAESVSAWLERHRETLRPEDRGFNAAEMAAGIWDDWFDISVNTEEE